MKSVISIFAIFFVIIIAGCSEFQQTQKRSLIVKNYIPAKQIEIPNLAKLKLSAEQGDAVAQYELGKLYAEGLGVSKSHHIAMDYFEKSAIQGYAPAQYSLGWMYFYGKGVITDFVEGCRWMRAAGDQGVQEAITHYNSICR